MKKMNRKMLNNEHLYEDDLCDMANILHDDDDDDDDWGYKFDTEDAERLNFDSEPHEFDMNEQHNINIEKEVWNSNNPMDELIKDKKRDSKNYLDFEDLEEIDINKPWKTDSQMAEMKIKSSNDIL